MKPAGRSADKRAATPTPEGGGPPRRTGTSGRDIPRRQVSPRTHGFGTRFAHALERQSRIVTIADRGRCTRSADWAAIEDKAVRGPEAPGLAENGRDDLQQPPLSSGRWLSRASRGDHRPGRTGSWDRGACTPRFPDRLIHLRQRFSSRPGDLRGKAAHRRGRMPGPGGAPPHHSTDARTRRAAVR